MVRKNKGLLHTALVSGLAMVTAACSSIDSKATQTTDGQGSTNTAKSAQLPMPVATLGTSTADLQRPAISAALEQINELNQKRQYEQSLVLTQQLLKQYPDAPDLALMEGVLFNQLKRTDEAEQVFLRLSEKHPELPEPLNNLAVIYVNRGDLNRAISTLQKAFETHPSYARVQSNLRTLYTTLASQAYNRALNLGSQAPAPVLASLDRIPEQGATARNLHNEASLQIAQNQPAQIIRTSNRTETAPAALTDSEKAAVQADVIRAAQQAKPDTSTEQTVASAAVSEPQKAETVKAADVAATTVSKAEATPAAADKVAPAPEKVAAKPAPETKPETTKSETVVATAKPEAQAPVVAKAEPVVDHKALLKAQVMGWAKAWSNKDVSGYLSYYVDGYRPANRLSNKRWKKQRHQRLNKPKFIKVSVSGISIKRKGETLADVSFTQNYRTNTYRDKVIKTLTFKQQKGEWKISAEVSRKVR